MVPCPYSPTVCLFSDRKLAGRSCSQSSSLATVVENLPLSYNTDTKSLDRTPSLGCQGGAESPSTAQETKFRRGHIRRSSYESAQIQLNFARRITTANGTPALAPSAAKCLDEPLCSLSLNTRADCSSSSSEQDQYDSGIGCTESDSKRSSLDRRSELSDFDEPPSKPETLSKSRFFNFPKNFFSRNKEEKHGWKMFGSRNKQSGVMATTGLILEERPSGLPSKSADEAAHHKQMYLDILEQAKKKEQRAEKERLQAKAEQKRLEEQTAAHCRVWVEQILPKWEEMKDSKRCRELWWQGVPAKVRGELWFLTIGNQIEITKELYDGLMDQAEEKIAKQLAEQNKNSAERKETSVTQIHLDATRTFTSLGMFQKDGPYYDHLLKLLSAYAILRPDIGYVQSMTFIAAVLLIQMDPYPAFISFANLLDRSLQSAFFGLKQPQMTEYFIAYDRYLEQELPALHQHLDKLDVRPDLYLIEWTFAMYAKSLPLDVTCRIWDVYFRDGEEFLFKAALGILRMYEPKLLTMDFDDCVEFLTKLPNTLTGAELFRNIEPFMRPYNGESSRSKKRFSQIFQEIDERVNPGGTTARTQITHNVQELKMSKSLSGFIKDLLSSPSH
ncbi:Rab-GAP TBC domain-containing protein [Caenorhabditis elegans]|uniref:Rab-GAP TBC domain-containing protein n=1 Tax=Caenorhabditis elegans TaxID=6239 RepID=Q21928_CAEEL|nr:Rab-GAP TBC domain-containing protein [Caenorhabditis elegans]CCD71667.1 Rab-GAP TBC domain-containing protein [Caenorhabditis elegans]|eukprot:NP_508458.1 TBC (Tre-2/Bub2/Cdc16) domain family [Caenorhabditis elegans]